MGEDPRLGHHSILWEVVVSAGRTRDHMAGRGNGKERRGGYLTLGLCIFPARRPLFCPCPGPTLIPRTHLLLPDPAPSPAPPDPMPCHKPKLPPQPYLLLCWLIY